MKAYTGAIAAACGCVLYVAAATLSPSSSLPSGKDTAAFGRLPVFASGRVQPVDSVARMGLLQIRGSITVPLEDGPWWRPWRAPALSATEWLLEVLTSPAVADTRRVFPIKARLAGRLRLRAPGRGLSEYYSFSELRPKLTDIGKETLLAANLKAAQRSVWQQECLRLRNALVIYERLKNSLQPNSLQQDALGSPPYDFKALLTQYQSDLRQGVTAAVAREHGKSQEVPKETEERMRSFARPYVSVSRAAYVAFVPPAADSGDGSRWENVGTVIVNSARTGWLPAPVGALAAISSASLHGNASVFNHEVGNYNRWLKARGLGAEVDRARFEFLSNRLQAFVRATALYLAATATFWLGWRRKSSTLYGVGIALVAFAGTLHGLGLLSEMMVEGGPPVTSVYSASLLAAFGAVALAVVLELVRRDGLSLSIGALIAFTTLIYAHGLVPGGALRLMQTAFDGRFWLAGFVTVAATRWLLLVEATGSGVLRGRGVMRRSKQAGSSSTLDGSPADAWGHKS